MALQIDVSGNLVPITRNLDELKADLKKFKQELDRSTDAPRVAQLNTMLKETETEIKRIKNIGPIIPPSATDGANKAANALSNLSRVAQDAPFGFIGIQNNLNPLLESFQRLRVETGSNAAALKSMYAGLMGGAGIGLGLSVVSSLITTAIQKYGSLGNALEALFGSTTTAAQAQRDLAKSFAEAEGSAAGEIANVNALLNVARDETLSKKARTEAVKQLNKEYETYLPNLTLENINTKSVTESVDKLTQSLIRQAQIKGLTDLISKETAKQAELLAGNLNDNATAWGNIVAAVKSAGAGTSFFREQALAGAKATGDQYVEAQKRIEIFTKALGELTKQEALNGTLHRETSKHEEDALKKRLDALEKIKKSTKDYNELVKLQESIFDLQVRIALRDDKKRLDTNEFNELIAGYQKQLNDAFKNQAIALEGIPKITVSPTELLEFKDIVNRVFTSKEKLTMTLGENGVDVKIATESVDVTDLQGRVAKATGLDKIKIDIHDIRVRFLGGRKTAEIEGIEQVTKELNENIKNSLGDLKAGVAETIGEAFGEAIGTGDFAEGLKNGAKQLLSIMGSFMQQLGRYIIGAAIKIQALKETLRQFAISNPALAIAGGIALIAAGAALKNIQFEGPKFAAGGIVTGPTIGMVGEAGPEVIMPLRRLPDIMGQQPGGQQPINVKLGLGVSGRQLVALIEQETTAFKRIF